MKVPLLDLQAQMQGIRGEIMQSLEGVVDSCVFINGGEVAALEAEVADYVGAEFGIGVSSGTDALLVALMALDVGPETYVITTPYSFFATAGAISRLGATPVFIDINESDYNLSADALAQWCGDNQNILPDVRAIVPVHLYGQCADMDAIMNIAGQYDIPVVEDAAQAVGSKYQTSDGSVRAAGSMGDIGCYSFFPSKNLGGLGDGGMVVTSDKPLFEKIKKLKNHGSHPKYYHELIGGNFRLDALQAAALRVKLKYLDEWHAARQKNAQAYDDLLAPLADVNTPIVNQDRSYHIYNQYVIRVNRRDELRAFLQESQIGCEIYYPVPFHQQVCFQSLGYQDGAFPRAEGAAQETLAIPVYPELPVESAQYVATKLGEFCA